MGISKYMTSLNVSDNTKALAINSLRSYYRYLIFTKVIRRDGNVALDIPVPHIQAKEAKYLTQKDHYTFLLRKNDNPIGFINFSTKEKNNSTDKLGSIDLIGIDKNNQKKGYGLILIKYALNKLKELNVSEVSLIVNKENENAQKLYEKTGFFADSKSDNLRVWHYTKKI